MVKNLYGLLSHTKHTKQYILKNVGNQNTEV